MPRVTSSTRVYVTRNGEQETFLTDCRTYSEFFEEELCVNPSKFKITVDGVLLDDLSKEVEDDSEVVLSTKNYDSGC